MTEGSETPARGVDRVLDAGALRALAHPLRVKIYDILSQYGPQTSSSLAAQLGESSGSTSYHLRALAKQNLIREMEGRGTGRERWWERPRGAVSVTSPEVIRTPAGRAATQVVVSEFYRRRHEQLMEFLGASLAAEEVDWEAMLSTASVRLTAEQFEELREKLQAVVDETVDRHRDQRGDGTRLYSIRADVFPLPNDKES